MVQTIATQCPWEGGTAVYQARVMLNMLHPEIDYAGWCENIPLEIIHNRIEQSTANQFSSIDVFPNPASDEVEVQYSGLKTNSFLEIFDLEGKNIQNIQLNDDAGLEEISTYNFSNGVYFYRAKKEDGNYLTGKLTIVK